MTFTKIALVAAPLMALTMTAAAPAEAQSRYYDRRDNNSGNVVAGVVIGAIAGGLIASAGNDRYDRNGCSYYRDGYCWRNQGHWEREHGINSRDPRWQQRRDYREHRREERYDRWQDRRDYRRDYRYDRRW